ncbi:MAG: hypothetical protein Q9N67_02735 [Ghiorsea sp.]|nr:hypothetical protein [Ghiorsea sp.]
MIRQSHEKGFILATSLVMMLLMTMLTAAVFISVDASQKSSMSAELSAEAYYYAETATNYMQWSLYNNVEFDSYTYPQIVRNDGVANLYTFAEPDPRGYDPYTDPLADPYVYLPNPLASGDYAEWRANRFNPSGNDAFSFTKAGATVDIYGQLMYYDNSSLASRMVWYRSDDMYSKAVVGQPEMFEIHRYLPRYIMLSIDNYGQITPSMPPVNAASPWHNNVEGVDYPSNGAIVWVTGGNRTDDYEIVPMDVYAAPAIDIRSIPFQIDPYAAYIGSLPCDVYAMVDADAACLTSGAWVTDINYGLVIYAIGYVQGKPQRVVRAIY